MHPLPVAAAALLLGSMTTTTIPAEQPSEQSSGRASGQPSYAVVSVSRTGGSSNDQTFEHQVSPDGRWVAFDSEASNLVRGDDDGSAADIFLRDRHLGRTVLVSTRGEYNHQADVSANGTRVVYQAVGSDRTSRILSWTRSSGRVRRVDVAPDGSPADGPSYAPAVSGDGRYVVFTSDARNLVSGTVSDRRHVYRHDLRTGRTVAIAGTSLSNATLPAIDADGDTIGFTADGDDLVPEQEPGTFSTVVWRQGAGLHAISAVDPWHLPRLQLSASGRRVAVATQVPLTDGDDDASPDVFLTDERGRDARLLSRGPEMLLMPPFDLAADGGSVVFSTDAALVPGDDDLYDDVYRTRTDGSRRPALLTAAAEGPCYTPSVSRSGDVVAFLGIDPGLVRGDRNGFQDLLVRRPG